ncbi:MAG: (Fe-S)-binding protein [Candidatus Hydrogenedentota bacterium]|nr:MAG: (Fe-S)-binding protein [Candidatus Hydrogenedentota bacterium]
MEIALIALFGILFFGSFTIAGRTVMKYWRQIHLAQPNEIKTPMGERIKSVIVNVLFQRKLMKRPLRGIFHIFIFYGFLVYGMHTTSQFIGGFMADYDFYIPTFLDNLLGLRGHYTITSIYDVVLDIFTLLVLSGLAFFAIRRWVIKAYELDRPSQQSFIVILMISLLMFFTLIGEGAKTLYANHEVISPIRTGVGSLLASLGLTAENAKPIYLLGWWGHIITVFTFMIYVPRSKHAHLIWAPVNFYFTSNEPRGAIPFLDTENAAVWGATNVQDFTWDRLLDGLACIECGRCTIVCPANSTGKLLNPKQIMVDLKHAVMEKMDVYEKAKAEGKSDEELAAMQELRVIDQYTPEEALWGCTTCYSCVEQCPVGNNQVESILQMRRALVLNEGRLPTDLQNALTNIENQSNPWGVGAHKREEWAEGLEIKTMAQWAEEGKTPDILFWVGCAGAFDDRNKKVARTIVNLLNKADISFGILGQEENCTGDSARRAGNEYLFQMMAQTNIETMNGYGVKKILTACPHCFNTIKNEYPQLGGEYEVMHHSQFLSQLIEDGKLQVDSSKLQEYGNISYHDSCYLGRYNQTYSAPRKVLEKASGKKVLEPVATKETGLCCGAGGAQMWMEEQPSTDKPGVKAERVNIKRTNQLLDTGANTLATACPFCITMVSDGVKANEKEEEIKTKDIAELLEEAVV